MDEMIIDEGLSELSLLNAKVANLEFSVNVIDIKLLKDFEKIITLLSPVNHKACAIRVGTAGDGGYVICKAVLRTPRLISLGLGLEVTAESELLDAGYEVIAADGSVENPFPGHVNFKFAKYHIANRQISGTPTLTFREFVKMFNWDTNVEIVKIDIEGAEYDLLLKDLSIIQKARQIVIEFHGFELLGDQKFRDILIDLLATFHETHKPIHVHANNGAPGIRMAGGEWPTLLEVTFLRNEECINSRNHGPFPTNLDFPNTSLRPDIDLNPFFGTSPSYLQLAKFISSSLDLA